MTTIIPTTITRLLASWLEPATRCWCRDQCRDLSAAYYLYYKPGTVSSHGAVAIATEPLNEAWQLASPERVSPAWSQHQAYEWAWQRCWELPLLRTDPETPVTLLETYSSDAYSVYGCWGVLLDHACVEIGAVVGVRPSDVSQCRAGVDPVQCLDVWCEDPSDWDGLTEQQRDTALDVLMQHRVELFEEVTCG